ncbi:MAG: F420-0:Gamma-glutamyl ligase [Firmicutes bacterium ADurb.Bin182]|nr:MAG: F420-0:Gamma-glutamyl ligase [Firmicutes bacterium ADurb.Bin182]
MAGTISRGIKAPIIRSGDDLVEITVNSVLKDAEQNGYGFNDRDVVAVTEAVVAKSQGNYASVENIRDDIKAKFGGGTVGVLFPILSRNRFAIVLRGIALGCKKIVLQLSYPSDEVGNHLIDEDALDSSGVNPWSDVLSLEEFRKHFGYPIHPFTNMDYVEYYRSLIAESGAEAEVIFANRPEAILKFTKDVLCCDIHTRARTKRLIKKAGVRNVLGLDDILTSSVNGSGFNENYGLLGSNKASEHTVKLFPRDCVRFVKAVQAELLKRTEKNIEVMVYGDGAFKDPVGKIWELADPVVSPGYTDGLTGLPNELKLKYIADNDFANLSGEELSQAIRDRIRSKDRDLMGNMLSQGTTPRRLTDLIGSLCDLTTGSGDKGTPIVLIQNYFNNYAD